MKAFFLIALILVASPVEASTRCAWAQVLLGQLGLASTNNRVVAMLGLSKALKVPTKIQQAGCRVKVTMKNQSRTRLSLY